MQRLYTFRLADRWGTATLVLVTGLVLIQRPALTQPDAALTSDWLGRVTFQASGERARGTFVPMPADGRPGMFLDQPLTDVRREDLMLSFTWGEGDDGLRCALTWEEAEFTYRGLCRTRDDAVGASVELAPIPEQKDAAPVAPPTPVPDDAALEPPPSPGPTVLNPSRLSQLAYNVLTAMSANLRHLLREIRGHGTDSATSSPGCFRPDTATTMYCLPPAM